MTSTTTTAPATASKADLDNTLTSATAADTAADLLAAMTAMPAGHPSRPAL
ncbi:hypothetical protein SAMN06264365_124114, partial [Actinoplanes regularis]